MINLIPPHARKTVKIEYWVRVGTVWTILVAIGLLIAAVFFLPSYVLIKSQLSAYESSYNEASASDASYQGLESEVQLANAQAQRLLTNEATYSFTSILDELELLTTEAIEVEEITMERSETLELKQFTIRGTAATRIDLVAYRDAIEAHSFFTSAELPISNLAKDRDVPFSVTVTVTQSNNENL
jgi:hypothetical protein